MHQAQRTGPGKKRHEGDHRGLRGPIFLDLTPWQDLQISLSGLASSISRLGALCALSTRWRLS
jgi:hypothetical protein